jgi:nucleoside-diphosphate-sugar epimerase
MKEIILVVGGSGFIGQNLLNYNEKNNHLIYSTFNKNKPNSKKNIKINWLHLNLNDTKKYKKDILKIKPTVIIFLSWEKIPNFSKLVSQKNLLISKKFFKFIFQNNF